jgi:hypothetical protein
MEEITGAKLLYNSFEIKYTFEVKSNGAKMRQLRIGRQYARWRWKSSARSREVRADCLYNLLPHHTKVLLTSQPPKTSGKPLTVLTTIDGSRFPTCLTKKVQLPTFDLMTRRQIRNSRNELVEELAHTHLFHDLHLERCSDATRPVRGSKPCTHERSSPGRK